MNLLIETIMAPTTPIEAAGIGHAGNWPAWAEFGVQYQLRSITLIAYFPNRELFDEWLDRAAQNSNIQYVREYEWDWGPVLIK